MLNFSAPISLSRGLSKDLEVLPPCGPKHKITFRPDTSSCDLILSNVQKKLTLIDVDEENPEVIVKRYQEKLRENSKSRVAVDVTSKPAVDGRVSSSAKSQAELEVASSKLLGYVTSDDSSSKASSAEASFFLENFMSPPNFNPSTDALMPIALDSIDQFLDELINPLSFNFYTPSTVSSLDGREYTSAASSLLPSSDLFKAIGTLRSGGDNSKSGGNGNFNSNSNGSSNSSGGGSGGGSGGSLGSSSSSVTNAAVDIKDVSDASSTELLKDEMLWVKQQLQLNFDVNGDASSPRNPSKIKSSITDPHSSNIPNSTSSFLKKKDEEIDNSSENKDDDNINSIADSLVLSDIESSINKNMSQNRGQKGFLDSNNKLTWATTDTLDVSEFETLRPKMAMQFPFELDFFQKQAVMRLERRECIFVAAHTSAGKTVVAEYAIALSKKHMTRAVYTSPIKALSNQKYRDFREKFGASEVGLITGDISINPEACCLIMTTEILRSMLYRGADTVKDIEWVIFDEVHYVNDAERGVVWEEVIIMLPEKINLIFLSATTPNTVEFCDWIGRTKRRNVFVIATNKRPVPLQHFLFNDDDMYQVMSAETGYTPGGLAAASKKQRDKQKPKEKSAENVKLAAQRNEEKLAVAAKNAGVSVASLEANMKPQKEAPKAHSTTVVKGSGDPSGSKQQWLSLISILRTGGRLESGGQAEVDFQLGLLPSIKARSDRKAQMVKYEKLPAEVRAIMSKKEYEAQEFRGSEDELECDVNMGLLPVVVFCFSKKKCETICDYLSGQDFLTAKEKKEVRSLMLEAKSRLNPLDAQLPQILRVEDMLMRGVGVHHSGLLPILKECVEILFSKSIVRVLVATETFAMGVNMPARAVVFNGCRKHDGKSFRSLLPGEYTQMAGRAGRRGLDKVGTVIMAEWDDLPSEMDLKTLLTGTATKLSSQFRLSYGMILNLLRVNDLKVEDMIKRSFSEFHAQKALTNHDLSSRSIQYQMILEKLSTERLTQESEEERDMLDKYVSSVSLARRAHQQMVDCIMVQNRMDLNQCLSTGRVVCFHQSNLLTPAMGVIIKQYIPPKQADNLSSFRPLTSASPLDASSSSSGGSASAKLERSYWVLGIVSRMGQVPLVGKSASASSPTGVQKSGFVMPSKDNNKDKEIDINSFEFKEESGYFNADSKTTTAITAESTRSDFQDCYGYFIDKISTASIVFVTNKSMKLTMPKNAKTLAKEQLQPAFLSSAVPSLIESTNAMLADRSSDLSANIMKYSKEYKINDFDFGVIQSKQMKAVTDILSSPFHFDDLSMRKFNRAYKIKMINDKLDLIATISSNESLSHFPDFMQRLSLLKLLNYVDNESDTPNIKGRIACEINTCDELIATEIIFNNILEPLNPPEAAGILSALIFQEKTDGECRLTTRMEEARAQVTEIYEAVNELQDQEGVIYDAETKPKLNFGLAAVVYEWARGVPFKDITQMTDIKEGSIVRCIARLDELIKDVRNAARVIGNPSLYRKMEAASQCIKRDIVFAASLYVT